MDPFTKVRLAVQQAIPGLQLLLEKQGPDASEGERLLEHGNFEEAEAFFQSLVDELESRPQRRGKPGSALLALAKARWHQKKVREAEEAAEKAVPLLEGTNATVELTESLDLLGRIRLARQDIPGAIARFEEALAAQRKIRPLDQGAIIDRLRKLGEARAQGLEWKEATEALREAVEIAERECGDTHQLTADCLSGYGHYLGECGEHVEARKSLERALEIHTAACGADSEEVAKDFQGLAAACQAVEDLESAIHYYDRALRLRERQLGGSTADYASLLMQIAGANSLLGRYGPAVELMQQAVGRFEGTRDERLAPALESLGTVYLLLGRTDDALTSLKKARKIYEKQPEDNQDRIEANTRLFETASNYLSQADALKLLSSVRPLTEEELAGVEAQAAAGGSRSMKQRRTAKPVRPDPTPQAPAVSAAQPDLPPWPPVQPSPAPAATTLSPTVSSVPPGSVPVPVAAVQSLQHLPAAPIYSVPSAPPGSVLVPLSPAEAHSILAPSGYPAPADSNASPPGGVRIAVLSRGGSLPAAAPGAHFPAGSFPAAPGGGITIVVPGFEFAQRSESTVIEEPVPPARIEPVALNGWEDLACDFLVS